MGVPSLQAQAMSAAWNFNAIECGLQAPGLRDDFLSEAHRAVANADHEYVGFVENNMIDAAYGAMMSVCQSPKTCRSGETGTWS